MIEFKTVTTGRAQCDACKSDIPVDIPPDAYVGPVKCQIAQIYAPDGTKWDLCNNCWGRIVDLLGIARQTPDSNQAGLPQEDEEAPKRIRLPDRFA